jgi:hypothetical protein
MFLKKSGNQYRQNVSGWPIIWMTESFFFLATTIMSEG